MPFEFGRIILVPFPFTDQSGGKRRPAVIVSSDQYHETRRDLIIMGVTSQLGVAADELRIEKWDSARSCETVRHQAGHRDD